jgi:hypothetical protein
MPIRLDHSVTPSLPNMQSNLCEQRTRASSMALCHSCATLNASRSYSGFSTGKRWRRPSAASGAMTSLPIPGPVHGFG